LHTTASDGTWTPEQLVAAAQQAGIGLMAVTDHDSLAGVERAVAAARGNGMRVLPGIELSARLNGQLYHLLAYGVDLAHPALNEFVAENTRQATVANDRALRLLVEAGYPITLEDAAAYQNDPSRGGWTVLNFLIDRGLCRDMAGYFRLFSGSLRHPQPEFGSVAEAVAAAQAAGGTVILAHPGVRFYNGLSDQRLADLVAMGVAGLECYSCQQDELATRRFLEFCRRRALLVTGGSDCHGTFVQRPIGIPELYAHDLVLGRLVDAV